MNIVLCGMMGSGKTTVGKKIAQLTGREWYDTDEEIVKKYGEISSIFQLYGEAYFRGLETDIVKDLSQKDNLVISTGGGLVLKEENCQLLKTSGKIVFLQASLETLMKRLCDDNTRPLLSTPGETLQKRLEDLLKQRAPIYMRVADYIVNVDKKMAEENAKDIIALVENNKKV